MAAHTLARSANGAFSVDGNLYPKDKLIVSFPEIGGIQCVAIEDFDGNTILTPTDLEDITLGNGNGWGGNLDVARQWCNRNIYDRKDADGVIRVITAVGDNASNPVELPAEVNQIVATNGTTSPLYLKVYDIATTPDELATPVLTVAIPAKTAGGTVVVNLPNPIVCADGVGIRITAGMADGDTTATGDDDGIVQIWYRLAE